MANLFTEKQLKYMVDNHHIERKKLAKMFSKKFKREVSDSSIARKLRELGKRDGKNYSSDSRTYSPCLTTKPHNNGHIMIKYKGRWKTRARHVYEQHHNIKLTANDVIIHLDGDKTNDHVGNLKLSNRRIVAKLLKMGFSDNVKRTAVAIAELELKIKDIENDN